MKSPATHGFVTILFVGVAGGAFWLGQHWPVEGETPSAVSVTAPESASGERKILYYRNPMGQPDTSPVPKKDPMGMDYIPVYAGEEPQAEGELKFSLAKLQKLGVTTALAEMRRLSTPVRAVGSVAVSERGLHTVTARFSGWVEKLPVNTTGERVTKGTPLLSVYSPELVSTQQELKLALEGEKSLARADPETRQRAHALVEATRQRLALWAISEEQQKQAEAGVFIQALWLHAPVSGVVLEKPVLPGKRFAAGEPLMQIADLSMLWLLAEVFEQDLGRVRVGQAVQLSVDAFPGEVFTGRVDFVYPTLNAQTRTAPVRIELNNAHGRLRPAMFGQVEIQTGAAEAQLAIPDSALIDSGLQQTVLVDLGEGRFAPRQVKTGPRTNGWVAIHSGLKVGERVVTGANFLIDSESNLKAALAGLSTKPTEMNRVQHEADAKVIAVDAEMGSLTLAHQPVASLHWPAMTMDFAVANPELLKALRVGQKIHFWFEERGEGEWTVTRVQQGG